MASLYMKQDKKNNNLTKSQLIHFHSLAYSRQPLFQRQVSDFMNLLKTLFLFDTENGWMSNREN